ncbi:phage tail protein [Salmonella enterica]|uniref:phage tail protein n=7 Tax=Enterobacteriaceae TaxID=543 RepID=UPI000BE907CA|nr:phage tail protein [Escherichia coli]EAY2991796.1 phage tail protein [Salmonella enterica subsp. enterica serovar Typhimurium]ECX4962727.1 phage tail protein [Salmonella enterica]EEG4036315.1 phage tail protein [Salmonella enterica subsp. enterica serovar Infantis]EHG3818947.1 phage tail protein [Salmonella enterica subsp. enterica serovar Thompson]EIS8083068.1 phage tail protein [Salmonella enterica subsp. enterica serovar Braenderup]ELU5372878.1 phage tail protein [Salmonella enterica su
MTVKYYAILTNQGAARLANATMLGSKLNLTQMAVGDANGVLPTPDPAQTKLINQKRIAPLNLLSVDPNNQSQIIAEQIIPENEGGFWIREIGLYDDEGVLIAVANCPETYKPQLQEGSGRTQTIRMILVVTNTEAITLKIDPSVVLATRKYVDDEVLELRLYVDDQMRKHIAAQDPHTQYAQKHNPTFTGEPKAPTPAAGNNTTRIATTAFVQAAITALINGAPATLDTLKEIAAAINNDPKFSTTINNALSGKQPLDETLTHLSGKDVAGLLAYLGLGEGSALPVGVPVPWPSATPPTGWLKCNGAAFSAEEYPELAKAYPTNKLPDLRGEFIRGWDDGRGMDTGRAILSAQGDAIRNIYGEFKTVNTENYSIWESVGSFKGAVVPLNPSTNNSYFSLIRSMVTERTDGAVYPKVIGLDASRIVPTANENRPRNIAFNYIVRAA